MAAKCLTTQTPAADDGDGTAVQPHHPLRRPHLLRSSAGVSAASVCGMQGSAARLPTLACSCCSPSGLVPIACFPFEEGPVSPLLLLSVSGG
jgi:hypothetical protein